MKRTTGWAVLALALLAPGVAGQSAARAAAPGWIGFFAGFEETAAASGPVAVVLAVAAGSPAARVGLTEGDTVLALDGQPLTPERLKALAATLRAGERVELTVLRGGARRLLEVRAERRPASQTMMPDPVQIRVGSARRLLSADSADAAERGTRRPFTGRVLVRVPEVGVPPSPPEPTWATPFQVHVFGDARTDSLVGALKRVERRLLAARSAESARTRELAARVGAGGRIDRNDRALVRLRAEREALATEQELLRVTLEQIVAERVDAPLLARAQPAEWTMEIARPADPAPPAAPTPPAVTSVGRPLTPDIAGRDRVAGARLTPLNPGLAEYFGTSRGVLVVEVGAGTPAAEAGLRAGDVVLRVGNTDVDELDELRRAVGAAPAERPVPVVVLRKGARVQLALPR